MARPPGMRLGWLVLLAGCATAEVSDGPCCTERQAVPEDPPLDFAARVEGPARCASAAAALLPSDEAWRRLSSCVDQGHFTALRELTSGNWDRLLQSRPDAPQLVARVIAERGGLVDDDLQQLHERRVPLFSLSQALARPDTYRGALVIVRARLSPQGVLDETRVVSRSADAQLGAASVVQTRGPWPSDTRELRTTRRFYNFDVTTGQRALVLDGDPFLDGGDPLIVLARFDGLRDGDGWPQLSVLAHYRPAATLSY